MAELCRGPGVCKIQAVAAGGEPGAPLSGSFSANQKPVHKIWCCGVFKITPSLKSTPFSLFSAALGRTSTAQRHSFDNPSSKGQSTTPTFKMPATYV